MLVILNISVRRVALVDSYGLPKGKPLSDKVMVHAMRGTCMDE